MFAIIVKSKRRRVFKKISVTDGRLCGTEYIRIEVSPRVGAEKILKKLRGRADGVIISDSLSYSAADFSGVHVYTPRDYIAPLAENTAVYICRNAENAENMCVLLIDKDGKYIHLAGKLLLLVGSVKVATRCKAYDEYSQLFYERCGANLTVAENFNKFDVAFDFSNTPKIYVSNFSHYYSITDRCITPLKTPETAYLKGINKLSLSAALHTRKLPNILPAYLEAKGRLLPINKGFIKNMLDNCGGIFYNK